MTALEAMANGTPYRIIVNDEPQYFETQDYAITEAKSLVVSGEGIDSLNVQHLESGLHGAQWYTVETVTRQYVESIAKEIIWDCLLCELGGGEGENVARALIAAAKRLGHTEGEAMAAYDML